jgi:hypothetical protein
MFRNLAAKTLPSAASSVFDNYWPNWKNQQNPPAFSWRGFLSPHGSSLPKSTPGTSSRKSGPAGQSTGLAIKELPPISKMVKTID